MGTALDKKILSVIQRIADGGQITQSLTQLSTVLRPGSRIVITNQEITAEYHNIQFGLSKNPFEMQADLEAFIRLDQLRK